MDLTKIASTAILALLGAVAGQFVIALALQWDNALRLSLFCAGMGLWGLWLVRRKHVRAGLLCALTAAIVSCLYAGYLNRGVNNLAMTVLPVIVVFAGFLMDRIIVVGCAAMASLGIVAIQWLRWQEGRGTMTPTDIGVIATFGLTISLSAAAGYLMASRLSRALRELKQSEERWQLALLGSNDGIWDWNPVTNDLYVSERWKAMLGYGPEDLVGTQEEWRSLVHPEDLSKVEEETRKHLEGFNDSFSSEFRMMAKDGSYRWILSRGKAWRDEKGLAIRMVGSHKDITDHKEALARAEAASRAKTEFLANLSHEIRTPMNAVLGYAELLRNSASGSERQEYLNELTASASALQELLHHLLDLSRIDSGKMRIANEPFQLIGMLNATLALFRGMAKERNVHFRLQVAEGTPETVRGDEARVRQVLMNLVGNAVKFTRNGEVSVEVRRATVPMGIEFRVRDEGIGIPEAARDRVFEAFFQADSSETREHGGVGLGLAISKRLIEQMGGEIVLEAPGARGTSFRFWVPLEACAEATAAKPRPSAATGAKPARILLVEDNLVNQKIAARLLEKHSHCVRIAGSGEEAVQAAREESFDLILMDLHMPTMNGAEAAEAIRQFEAAERRTPIWALTAAASHEERERCERAGMDGFLTKPIQLEALLDAVKRVLEEKERTAGSADGLKAPDNLDRSTSNTA